MEVGIRRSGLTGSLQAPPSKSCTHRAMICAALAEGQSLIHSPLRCDDTLATAQALSMLDVETVWNGTNALVTRHGKLAEPGGQVFCGESGTTLRFMSAICASIPCRVEITGGSSLLARPIEGLTLALGELGVECETNRGYPPVRVKGPLNGGSVHVPGNVSSQYVSALLLAAPLASGPIEVAVDGRLESKSYVKMTLDMQRRFAVKIEAAEDMMTFECNEQVYRPAEVEVEGDWSSAAFLLAAPAIAGERVTVNGLSQETPQADRMLLAILKRMDARVSTDSSSVEVEKSELRPISVDVADTPDLFPVVCALCAAAHGVSTITGIRRLRIKESNRVLAMREGLSGMGIKTRESEDTLTIEGGELRNAIIDPHHDHRIAMAFALLGLCSEVKIVDAESVSKSYPSFWDDLRSLGAEVLAK